MHALNRGNAPRALLVLALLLMAFATVGAFGFVAGVNFTAWALFAICLWLLALVI